MKRVHVVVVGAAVMVAFACGSDSSGPSLTYPNLPAALQAALCVRGNMTAGQTVNGSIADTDCDLGDSYYETYVLKVAANRNVTITMESTQFDTFVWLLRLNSYNAAGDSADISVIATDDDGGGGTNSQISNAALNAASDYLVVANGFAYADVGTYTLRVQ